MSQCCYVVLAMRTERRFLNVDHTRRSLKRFEFFFFFGVKKPTQVSMYYLQVRVSHGLISHKLMYIYHHRRSSSSMNDDDVAFCGICTFTRNLDLFGSDFFSVCMYDVV